MKTLVSNKSASTALLTTPIEVEAIIAVFEKIATSENWQPGTDLRQYVARSVYLAAMNDDTIVGGIQLVLGDKERPLPYISFWPEILAPLGLDIGHVLILAIEKEYRGSLGLFGLISICLWQECKRRGVEELWLEATPAKLKVYRRLGWPLCVRGPLRNHWGEPCVLNSLSVAAAEAGVRACIFWRDIVKLADQSVS